MLSQNRSSIASVLGGKNSKESCSSGRWSAVLRLARRLSSIMVLSFRLVGAAETPEADRQAALLAVAGKVAGREHLQPRHFRPVFHLLRRQAKPAMGVVGAQEFQLVRG